jgi:hypothetical protein
MSRADPLLLKALPVAVPFRDMMSKQITYQKRDPVLQIHASISPKLNKREAKE